MKGKRCQLRNAGLSLGLAWFVLVLVIPSTIHAGGVDVSIGVNFGLPGVIVAPPVVAVPQVVVATPPPVVMGPPPVVVGRVPVVVPQTVVVSLPPKAVKPLPRSKVRRCTRYDTVTYIYY